MRNTTANRPRLAGLLLAAVLAVGAPTGPRCWAAGDGPDAAGKSDGKAKPDRKGRTVTLEGLAEGVKSLVRQVGATSRPAAGAKATAKADSLADCEKLFMQGRYVPAADAYRRLTDRKELRVAAGVGQANALGVVGKYDDALAALRKVASDAAARADWHVAMGELLHTVGQYAEALDHAGKAHGLRPTWAAGILLHGRVLETLGRKAEAVEVYRSMAKAIEADDYRKDAPSLVALGRIMDRYSVLTGQRASEQASNILHNYFQEAYLKVDKGYWPANVAAGVFLLTKHRPETAAKEFELATTLNKDIPDVYVGLGAIELGKWRFEQCQQAAERALKINPNHADALLLKAVCLMQWRKFDQVPPVVEKVLKVNPNHIDALSLMAAAYVRTFEDDKARPYMERVRKIDPRCAVLPNTIGEWMSAGRQFEQAEKYYREAMKLAPELAEPVTNLGRMYMQTGDEDKAVEVLQKAHEIDDFRSDVVNFLNLLNKMKKYDVKETEHFIVRVDGQHDAILLEQVAEYMERIHGEVTTDFDYTPEKKTIIEFFPTHSDFSVRITGRGWIGTVGACTGRVIALAAPNMERSQFGTHNWATVLRHEYAHAVTLAATGNRIPHWLTEACAVFQQPDKRNYSFVQMLVQATRTGRLFGIKEMDWGFIRPQRAGDRTLAYAQSEWALEFIIEAKGFGTIAKMLKGFRDGQTQAEVFEKVVGIPEKDFDQQFRAWAKETVRKWGFNPEPPPDYAKAAEAVKARPDDAGAQATFAAACYNRRDLRRAEEAARAALKIDPRHTRALAVLAVCLAARKAYDEAIVSAEQLEGLDHTTHFAPKVLAQCHIARKDWARAISALELLQQRQPLDSFSYEELAKIYNQLGQPEKALPNLVHLHRHTMRDPKYARQIAEIYRAMKQDDQALLYFEQITHINPYQPNAYEAMAAIYRSQREYDKAVEAIEKVCLLEPDSADAWAKTAMMRYLAGRAQNSRDRLLSAKEAARKAMDLDPASRARQVLDRIEAALETMEKPT